MRVSRSLKLNNSVDFKSKLLQWSQQFEDLVWLDSNNYEQKYTEYSGILAVGGQAVLKTDYQGAFNQLKSFLDRTNDWLFGYLSYDLKNDVEHLFSENKDELKFPELYFFQPKKLFIFKDDELSLNYLEPYKNEIEKDLQEIENITLPLVSNETEPIKIKLRIHKDDYFRKIDAILDHIHRGDIYEANFCQEFYAENTKIDPLEAYNHLNAISRPPFATFLKCKDSYLLSASPERFLKKIGNQLISQPIKGTAKRSKNAGEDKNNLKRLEADQKERSENIMIVDLVRNDLSKTAIKGSVVVEELCKVYTFDQVHQMISTISSRLDEGIHPVDTIKACFPMGSMTGAPKISAMKIIEELEESKRGLYSGAVGYFTPQGDFDFNVVIRSILYNARRKYVSYSVGGAITAKSNPIKEYEECLIKAKAMRTVLEG